MAHWTRIQTANWTDIDQDEDFGVVCKQCKQSVAHGLRPEFWTCETCHCVKALELYSVRDQVRIYAHWARIQTANWEEIDEDEDFSVVCKQCKAAERNAIMSSSA